MKKLHIKSLYFISSLFAFIAVLLISTSSVRAASVPYLSLISTSGGQVTVTVTGADPDVSVLLYYPSTSAFASVNIGTTNASGYLMTTINSTTYSIAPNAPVYVTVDGQQSQQQSWPNYTSTGGLTLSQTNVTLSAGQSTIVSASVSSALSLSNNSNPGVASVSISGNQITVIGLAFGTSNITVCAANIGCGTMQVSVTTSSLTGATSVSFSQSVVSLPVGQTQQITISGSGSYYISSNSNSAIVSASLSGSVISLSGISTGSATLSVCSANSGSTTCGTINVNVAGSSVQTTNTNNTTNATLSFSPSNVSLYAGQSQSVTILGGTNASTVYYVSSNTAPNVASANTNGATVTINGIAFGGDNMTICQSGGPCGNLYVYVSPTGTIGTVNSNQTVTNTSNTTPVLSSFTISTNSASGTFISGGSVLTATFNMNQTVNTPTVSIGGTPVSVSGSGSGPYVATYSLPTNISLPLPIAITFTSPIGTGGQSYLWIGNSSSLTPSSTGVTSSNNITANALTFTKLLGLNSTGSEVRALQQRLKDDGVYSGPVTGTFGPLTEAALKKYQSKNGLSQAGVVGPSTRALLNKGI